MALTPPQIFVLTYRYLPIIFYVAHTSESLTNTPGKKVSVYSCANLYVQHPKTIIHLFHSFIVNEQAQQVR